MGGIKGDGMAEPARATRGHGLLEGFLARQRAKMADRLIPNESRGGRVLDIGCGSYPLFLTQTQFAEKHGLDRADAGSTPESIQLHRHDVSETAPLPFSDDFFDAVTMLAVFEHLDREAMARLAGEIHRMLRPNGVYVLTTPAAWTNPILQTLSFLGLVSEEEIDEHQPLYGLAEIRSILTNAGFRSERISSGYFELGLNTWARATK
jgi:2-polyprenyl-3-methyl-5-hydroxy-6-metoxy-1,4-benzoquinol methylase